MIHQTFEPKFKNGTKITSYLATAYAEGFCEGEGATQEDQLRAWAYLIKTGMCWKLQGWFGRMAKNLLDSKVISKDGIITWQTAEI